MVGNWFRKPAPSNGHRGSSLAPTALLRGSSRHAAGRHIHDCGDSCTLRLRHASSAMRSEGGLRLFVWLRRDDVRFRLDKVRS